MADFRDDDVTPPPIDLSRPRIHVEPTMQGLANGILNTYEELIEVRKGMIALDGKAITRDDCAANRAACPAARQRRPSLETRRRWWTWLDTSAGAIMRVLMLAGMIGSAAWWLINEVAVLKASQIDMKTQIVRELRGTAQRGR